MSGNISNNVMKLHYELKTYYLKKKEVTFKIPNFLNITFH